MSADSPLGTLSAWTPKNNKSSTAQDLPEGWLPCDGSVITKGPWAGGKTPDLNNEGRFLRGGNENDVLELQDDQIQDHEHEDPGHTHDNDPHRHGYIYDLVVFDADGTSDFAMGSYHSFHKVY